MPLHPASTPFNAGTPDLHPVAPAFVTPPPPFSPALPMLHLTTMSWPRCAWAHITTVPRFPWFHGPIPPGSQQGRPRVVPSCAQGGFSWEPRIGLVFVCLVLSFFH